MGRAHAVAAALVATGLVATGLVSGCGNDDPTAPLQVTWREREGQPGCTYDAVHHQVTVRLIVTGEAGKVTSVAATVTAYADENTSDAVGASTRSVPVRGTMSKQVDLTIRVTRAPHVDEDGVAACRLRVVKSSRP